MAPDYAPLWAWIKEREAIRIRKASGSAQPWTDDPILAEWRFCNVRREDDTVTVWIRQNIREPYADNPYLWLMLCIARLVNWPPALGELIEERAWPTDDLFDPKRMTKVLHDRKARGDKVETGAYMIPAPQMKGGDKQQYVCEAVLGDLWRRRATFLSYFDGNPSIKGTHHLIHQSKGWGDFLAYQAVVDMRFTKILRDADDVRSWAAAGPGTIRGLNRIHGRKFDGRLEQSQARLEMREIYKIVEAETGVVMDFSDVPNILCETDKYLRVKNGEGTPRARYAPGAGF